MKKKFKLILSSILILATLTACGSNDSEQSPDLSDNIPLATPDVSGGDEVLNSPDIDDGTSDINANQFGEFTGTTLTGDELTNKVFEDYDLTMVNIWATWCSPCVKEMPELAELYDLLPENMNLITICSDASTQEELANAILDDASANFQTVISNDEINSTILSRITAFPTSVFVDNKGDVVYAVEGAPNSDDIAGVYFGLMQEIEEVLMGDTNEDIPA